MPYYLNPMYPFTCLSLCKLFKLLESELSMSVKYAKGLTVEVLKPLVYKRPQFVFKYTHLKRFFLSMCIPLFVELQTDLRDHVESAIHQ